MTKVRIANREGGWPLLSNLSTTPRIHSRQRPMSSPVGVLAGRTLLPKGECSDRQMSRTDLPGGVESP